MLFVSTESCNGDDASRFLEIGVSRSDVEMDKSLLIIYSIMKDT